MAAAPSEPFTELFREETEHGLLVAVSLPELDGLEGALATVERELAADELAFVAHAAPRRRRTFLGGRVTLRRTLTALGALGAPILVDDRGAPLVEPGFVASVSHKDTIAVALGRRGDKGALSVGVDVEVAAARSVDIGRHVLTSREQTALGRVRGLSREREVVLRFSMKEALYKVLDPSLRRYIGFTEVEIDPLDDGSARVSTALKDGPCPVDVAVAWRERAGYFISTARAEGPCAR